eukprot:symbB.v1.2.001907.t2/scaffold102.1/size330044/4
MAATSSMLQLYQPFINLWRCYALSHGMAFILETDPGKAPAANWMRWFAAERFLYFYEALLIVDPDQVIVAPCWHLSIAELLGTWTEDGRPPPDVGLRDFGRPQTLNNGVALLRNSPRGWQFLRLLLQKAPWLHTTEHDQGRLTAEKDGRKPYTFTDISTCTEESYDSECVQYLFPNFNGNHDLARYAMCWWRQSEVLAGPFGQRDSQVIRFLDPRRYDVNHVVGARGLSDPALLYHFAGRSKALCLRVVLMADFYLLIRWTCKQLQTDAATDDQCPKTEYAREVDGKAVIDWAYKGGRLRLSEVALNMKDTFCGKQNCYMGVISAGGASGDDEKEILFEHLKVNSEDRLGGSGFGQFAAVDSVVNLQKIVFTPDPQKGDVAKKIFDWLNSDTGKKAGIPANKVWLFDDHLGNAGEMGKYGFNGREVSCKTRDQSIGNGLVGLCGAELSEIIPSEGISTCADPK